MIIDDVYVLMNDILRSNTSADQAKKLRAYNEGARELVKRMADMGRAPGALLERDSDLSGTAGNNYLDLPSDFCKLQKFFKKSGDSYLVINDGEFYTLEGLQHAYDEQFTNSSSTITEIDAIAIDDDKVYVQGAFASTGNIARIWYWKYMAAVTDLASVTALELGDRYKLPLAIAAAALYLYLEGSIEAVEKDQNLDNAIKLLGDMRQRGTIRVRPGV